MKREAWEYLWIRIFVFIDIFELVIRAYYKLSLFYIIRSFSVKIDEAKGLGASLDTSPRFCRHIFELIRKAYFKVSFLYISWSSFSVDLKRMLCDVLIFSSFIYCVSACGPCLILLSAKFSSHVQKIYSCRCLEIVLWRLGNKVMYNLTISFSSVCRNLS